MSTHKPSIRTKTARNKKNEVLVSMHTPAHQIKERHIYQCECMYGHNVYIIADSYELMLQALNKLDLKLLHAWLLCDKVWEY